MHLRISYTRKSISIINQYSFKLFMPSLIIRESHILNHFLDNILKVNVRTLENTETAVEAEGRMR